MNLKGFVLKVKNHLRDFCLLWSLLGALFITARVSLSSNWGTIECVLYFILFFWVLYLLWRPMGVVYGLMGTSGSIHLFFFNFIFITVLFACIYHWAFFRDAGVSYDVNQPHFYYDYFKGEEERVARSEPDSTTYVIKRIIGEEAVEELVVQIDSLTYQPVSFGETWRNTIMTALMQEPTDFFAAAVTYNAGMERNGNMPDKSKSEALHWILILQILISWIFFGVFISLLYNKFRYES